MPDRIDGPPAPRRLQRFRLRVLDPAIIEIALPERRTGDLLLASVDLSDEVVALLALAARLFEGEDVAALVLRLWGLNAEVGDVMLVADKDGDTIRCSGGGRLCALEGMQLLMLRFGKTAASCAGGEEEVVS